MIRTCAVYLAGSSKDLGRVRLMAERLSTLGTVSFPHPWWTFAGIGHDAGLSKAQRRAVSLECRTRIVEADLFWLLYPTFGCHSSCHAEYGYALATSAFHEHHAPNKLIVSGPSSSSVAFCDDEWATRFDGDEAAFQVAVSYAEMLSSWRAQLPEVSP